MVVSSLHLTRLALFAVLSVACSSKSSVRGFDTSDAGPDAASGGNGGSGGSGGSAATGGDASGATGGGGSGGGGSGGTGGGAADLDCEVLAVAQCERVSACAPSSIRLSYGSLENCVVRLALQCSLGQDAPGSDPTSGAGCPEVLHGTSCTDLFGGTLPDVCRIMGTLASGSSCKFSAQCASGYCNAGVTAGSCGTCREQATEGAACTPTTPCASGLFCGSALKCVALGKLGNACDPAAAPCQTMLACISGVCAPPLPAGSPCDPAAYACNQLTSPLCTTDTSGNTTCQPIPIADLGGSCGSVGTVYVLCSGDGYCDPTSSSCVTRPVAGEACSTQSEPASCLPPLECANGVCRFPDASTCS